MLSVKILLGVLICLYVIFAQVMGQMISVGSCETLDVQGTADDSIDPVPYKIQLSEQFYSSGTNVTVHILQASCTDWTFEEIIIQARTIDGGKEPVGIFSFVNNRPVTESIDFQTYDCPLGVAGSTLGTLNSRKKVLPLTITWQAPSQAVGDIYFLLTIIQQTGIYWERVSSQVCRDANAVNGPPIFTCPGNIYLPVSMSTLINTTTAMVSWIEPRSTGQPLEGNPNQPFGYYGIEEEPALVVYQFTAGAMISICEFNVSVHEDIAKNTPPTTPTCPDSTVSVTSPRSSVGATVSYDPITCCDVEQGTITAQCNGPISGSLFPTGKTSITCMCLDDGGLSSSCTFIVDVKQAENTPPVITCPAPVTAFSLPNNVGNTASWADPTCNDLDQNDITLTTSCNPTSGSFFSGVQSNSVTCTCTDNGGLSDTCVFTVTVSTENTPPVITCPAPVNVSSFFRDIGNIAFWAHPVCTDLEQNDITPIVNCNPRSGSFFRGVEPNVVICTCTDNGGLSDTCLFTVTVEAENTPPVISCPSSVRVSSLGNNVGSTASWADPTCTDLEQDDITLAINCNPVSGSFFSGAQSNFVTCNCTDKGGLSDTCVFTVTVETENTPPVITCPAPVTVFSLPNNVGNTASWTDPTCTDLEQNDITLTINCNPVSGSFFSGVQSNSVTCTCADNDGLSDTCVFTVTVNTENTPPVISCPAPITISSLANNVGNTASWIGPACTDSEQDDITLAINCNPVSGSFFSGVQSNTVTCTCTDNGGLSDTCVFTVTVETANTPPVITCPAPVTVFSLPNNVGNTASWADPTCTDSEQNDITLTINCNPVSGSFFSGVQSNTVTCTCTDNDGLSDTCVFTVTVENPCNPNPCQVAPDINCYVDSMGNQQCTSGHPCQASPPPWRAGEECFMLPQNLFNCTDSCNPNPCSVASEVNCYVDSLGNRQCTSGHPCLATPSPCSTNQQCFPLPNNAFVCGVASRKKRVANDIPGESTCQNVLCKNGGTYEYFYGYSSCRCANGYGGPTCAVKVLLPITNCPNRPISLYATANLTQVTWKEPTSVLAGTNANEVLTRTSYLGSSDYFPVGVTRVSYRNQIAKCTFNVIVQGHILDTTPPKIYNCPERQLSMTVENEQENVTSLWSEIFAEDESCQPVQITSSHKPRDYFFVGVTLVTYNFTDSSGNLAQCIFSVNISVLETEQNRGSPPGFAFCPESIVVNSSSGTTRTQVTWVEPILRSSVTAFTLYQSHFPGDSFPVGRTNVIYEIQVLNDDSTTQVRCRFDVYVKDVSPPTVFNCPQERRIKSCRGLKVVYWYEPIAVGNSGFPVTVSQSHKPGSSKFKARIDTVIYTFTDGSGNIATCSFNVILHRDGCGLVTSIFTLCFGLLVALLLIFILILHFTYRRSTRQRHTDTS